MLPPITPTDPDANKRSEPGPDDGATIHPIRKPAASWLFEWGDARERIRVAATDAARALAQSDQLDNELIATAHDSLMQAASRAFAHEFGITVDMLPERRLAHIHRPAPTPPVGDAS